jgi:hypothetical protein
MSKRSSALSRAAIVVAMLALVAGLTGVAVAGTSAKKVTTKKVKKISTKIANQVSLQVADQEIAAKGNPIAYAHIKTDGTVVGAESKGIENANVTTKPASSYCLHGVAGFKSVSATPDYQSAATDSADLSVRVGLPGSGFTTGCNTVSGAQAEIVTVRNAAFTPHGFYVQLYN